MHSSTWGVILVLSLLSTFLHGHFLPCSDPFHQITAAKNLTNCKKLNTLEAEFAWSHRKTAAGKFFELEFSLGTTVITPDEPRIGWLAWGVNPETPKMVGTRAVIGIMMANGTNSIHTYKITKDTRIGCALRPSEIDVEARNLTVEYSESSGHFVISGRMVLPVGSYNVSNLNHVWQIGHFVDGDGVPLMHRSTLQNFDSKESLNLVDRRDSGVGHPRHRLRKVHGILNIIGWGVFIPIGVIISRYFKTYPFKCRWWFTLHVSCQTAGYVLGTIGWAIGLWLGHASKFYIFYTHRVLAICIFVFTTLQILAFRLKPVSGDEYRKHWNVYHHFLGYALIAIVSVNIFHGINILKPRHATWRWSYIGIIVALGLVALALEIYTWIKFLASKKAKKNKRRPNNHSTTSSSSNEEK